MSQSFTAFVINLDRDRARLSHMESQLARAGIAFTRRTAILGDAAPAPLRLRFFHADGRSRTAMTRGEVGCYASHLDLLGEISRGRHGAHALVMEDDLDIAPDLRTLLAAAIAAMPDGWDILRLSNPPQRAYAPLAALGDRLLIRYSRIPMSAGAYLVTPQGARKFLDRGVRGLTFDDDLRRPWFHGMDSYGIVPPPIRAGVCGRSSIDAVEARPFDGGIGPAMKRLRRGDPVHVLQRTAYNMRKLGFGGWLKAGAINLADMGVRLCGHPTIIHRAARWFRAGPHA